MASKIKNLLSSVNDIDAKVGKLKFRRAQILRQVYSLDPEQATEWVLSVLQDDDSQVTRSEVLSEYGLMVFNMFESGFETAPLPYLRRLVESWKLSPFDKECLVAAGYFNPSDFLQLQSKAQTPLDRDADTSVMKVGGATGALNPMTHFVKERIHMLNTKKIEANEKTFGTDVLQGVRNHIHRVANTGEWEDFRPAVGLTGMVKHVAEALSDLMSCRSVSVPVSDSDIEEFLCTLVHYRCLQLARNLPKGVSAMDVPVPDFFRPVLAKICKYEDNFRALEITPKYDPNTASEEWNGCQSEGRVYDLKMDFTKVLKVARLLKGNGVKCTNGLPSLLVTDDDALFRVREDEQGFLLVAGEDVSEVDLLVRSIIRMQFLDVIFGAARTRYVSVEDLRTAWDAIVQTGFCQ